MSDSTFGPIELFLFLGTPLLLSTGALAHHLWTERRGRSSSHRPNNGGQHVPKD